MPSEAGAVEGCKWCEKGECWDHGQIEKPGKGGGKAMGGKGGKPGDWNCPNCGDLVFGSKDACRMCGTPKPGAGAGGKGFGGGLDAMMAMMANMKGGGAMKGGGMKGGAKPGDWTCPSCGDNVFAYRDQCRQCGTGKPAGAG